AASRRRTWDSWPKSKMAAKRHKRHTKRNPGIGESWWLVRLIVLASVFMAVVGFALSHHSVTRPVHAFSAGPPAGYTGAPQEESEACAECHVPPDAGTGKIFITAPQTYVPGQTYPI